MFSQRKVVNNQQPVNKSSLEFVWKRDSSYWCGRIGVDAQAISTEVNRVVQMAMKRKDYTKEEALSEAIENMSSNCSIS
jgi:hypothetical protein